MTGFSMSTVLESPTHVGMDRPVSHQRRPASREPHARGDGPELAAVFGWHSGRAPRTWGWTAAETPHSIAPPGEPHARGDGPFPGSPRVASIARAPRTWGWTNLFQPEPVLQFESPTHVGMDRRTNDQGRHHNGEPHARGDGPGSGFVGTDRGMRAPRTWGWTGMF